MGVILPDRVSGLKTYLANYRQDMLGFYLTKPIGRPRRIHIVGTDRRKWPFSQVILDRKKQNDHINLVAIHPVDESFSILVRTLQFISKLFL